MQLFHRASYICYPEQLTPPLVFWPMTQILWPSRLIPALALLKLIVDSFRKGMYSDSLGSDLLSV